MNNHDSQELIKTKKTALDFLKAKKAKDTSHTITTNCTSSHFKHDSKKSGGVKVIHRKQGFLGR